MDETFVKKVYSTIVYTWATAMLWAFACGKLWIAISITFGVIIGTAVLATYDVAIRRIIVPGAKQPKRALVYLIGLKYIAIIVALYWLVKWHRISPIALLGGVVLTHFAILAKLAGIKIQERLKPNESNAGSSADTPIDKEK